VRKLLGVITAGVLLSGCATTIPVNKDVGSLNMNYQTKEAGAATNLVVAIVSPEFAKNSAAGQQQNPNTFSASSTFDGSYKARLTGAIQSTIEELISKRGFTTKGPFATLDDMNYGDKKSMYLISTPKLTINMDQKQTSIGCKGMVCSEQGEIQIGGELTFKLIEPLTGQSMMTKRIDLTSLTTAKVYVKQWQARVDPASMGGMLAKAQAPESLQDNTDRAMTEAINEFYQKAMTKLDTMLSREEMLSFQADIAQLKALKRF
jgi:Neuraminyllactose-binding hemagglutinin precursor (NLBH)